MSYILSRSDQKRVQVRTSKDENAMCDLKEFPDTYESYDIPTEPRKLSAADSVVFAESLLNPKEPNELL